MLNLVAQTCEDNDEAVFNSDGIEFTGMHSQKAEKYSQTQEPLSLNKNKVPILASPRDISIGNEIQHLIKSQIDFPNFLPVLMKLLEESARDLQVVDSGIPRS